VLRRFGSFAYRLLTEQYLALMGGDSGIEII
jgi:hypothetical protein